MISRKVRKAMEIYRQIQYYLFVCIQSC